EKYNEAVIQYRNALKIDPNSSDLYTALGDTYLKSKQFRDAYAAYQKAAQLNPKNFKAQASIVQFNLIVKNWQDAIHGASEILEQDPNNREGSILLAAAYAGKGDYAEAHRINDELLKREPKAVPALLQKGTFFLTQRQPDNALPYYEQAVAADPNSVEAHHALAAYHLMKGNQAGAEAEYR